VLPRHARSELAGALTAAGPSSCTADEEDTEAAIAIEVADNEDADVANGDGREHQGNKSLASQICGTTVCGTNVCSEPSCASAAVTAVRRAAVCCSQLRRW
jgi:hypothetical protein